MILLDVGVWLAAMAEGHSRHQAIAAWFQAQSRSLVLCRVTQMGLLRLVTNPAVMKQDAVSRKTAWELIDQLRRDPRVIWSEEPEALEAVWRTLAANDDNSHKLWTDGYLAAFAQAAGMPFATLDRRCAQRYPTVGVETLIGS